MLKHLFWVSGRANRAEFIFWSLICQLVTCIYLVLQISMPLVSSPADYSPAILLRGLFLLLMAPISWVASWVYIYYGHTDQQRLEQIKQQYQQQLMQIQEQQIHNR